ncbi:MAG: hypothetical protein JWL73_35 [Actinomycetia bacterium]|nr:hypothetical protein [Actinomycetes bacterium]
MASPGSPALPPDEPEPRASTDPVLVRRAQVARGVAIASRVGYGLLLTAIVAFVIGALSSFPGWTVTVTIVGLVAACVILPVPIVLGYGVRAADREDRGGGSFH